MAICLLNRKGFYEKDILYLKYIFSFLKLNFGTILVFELLYKLSMAAIFKPVLKGILKIALRVQGLNFLSDETIGIFLKAPSTWIFLIIIILGITFFTLFDICCIIICIHASCCNQQIPLLALIDKGFKTAVRVIYPKNLLMILYLLIIIPMTHAIIISGYMTEFSIPDFIMEYIFLMYGWQFCMWDFGSILVCALFTGFTVFTISAWKDVISSRREEKAGCFRAKTTGGI